MNGLIRHPGIVGIAIAVLAGLLLGHMWPSAPLHAVATDRHDTCIIATGPIEGGVEGVYVLDVLTGTLKAGVISRQTGKFNAYFEYNVLRDFGIVVPSAAKFLLVTGAVDLVQGAQIAQPSQGVVYVAEANSGRIAAYAVPWLRQRYVANQPIAGQLVPLDMWQFRVTPVRDQGAGAATPAPAAPESPAPTKP